MAEIDKACRRILEAKYKLGLFDDPYKYCDASRVKKDIFTAENRTVARKIATETFVLLKNENNLLPLQRKGKIALVGPLANTKANMPGTWSVAAASDKYNSLYESMKQSLAGKAQAGRPGWHPEEGSPHLCLQGAARLPQVQQAHPACSQAAGRRQEGPRLQEVRRRDLREEEYRQWLIRKCPT